MFALHFRSKATNMCESVHQHCKQVGSEHVSDVTPHCCTHVCAAPPCCTMTVVSLSIG